MTTGWSYFRARGVVMKTGVLFEFPSGSMDQYEKLTRELNLAGKMAPGGMYRFVGSTDNGWMIFGVWDSREAFDDFYRQHLEPAARKLGLRHPQPKYIQIHDIVVTQQTRESGR